MPLLVAHFLRQASEEKRLGPCTLAAEALERLVRHDWPGNVRELENLIERLRRAARSRRDRRRRPARRAARGERRASRARRASSLPQTGVAFHEVVDRFEADLIREALEQTHWNKNQAARLLGLNRTTLLEKIKKKGLAPDV